MDVQQLRAFRSVMATGSVRAAAETLGYSPSAISQQVTSLQKEVGLPLFSRVGRGVEPTAAAHALAARVDGVLDELGDLDHFIRSLRDGRSTSITLAYFASLGATWLPGIVGPLVEEFPDTSLNLLLTERYDPMQRPRPDVQLLIAHHDDPVPKGYSRHLLTTEDYVVTLPAAHRLAGRDSIKLTELQQEVWIDNDLAQGACRQVVLETCASAGFRPRFRVQTHDYVSANGLVNTGLGVSVMPTLGAHHLPANTVAVPLVDPTPQRLIYALVRDETAGSAVVTRALELCRAEALSVAEHSPDLSPAKTARPRGRSQAR